MKTSADLCSLITRVTKKNVVNIFCQITQEELLYSIAAACKYPTTKKIVFRAIIFLPLTEMTTATGMSNLPGVSLTSVMFLMTCVLRASVLALLRMAFLSRSIVISTAIKKISK